MISPGKGAASVRVLRFREGQRSTRKDVVAVEEPLEIRVEEHTGRLPRTHTISITMRTPGDDFQLAAGFLRGEGILTDRREIREISYCTDDVPQEYNIVVVRLRPGVSFDEEALDRNFYMTSSCGVCGKASLDAVEVQGCRILPRGEMTLEADVLARLPETLREDQGLFDRTGGLHAAGLFDAEGTLVSLHEDVGRHNAVDKVVGEAFLADELPLNERILAVSGRASFEILQKALVAEIPVVVAVGAPSSLAVDLASRFDMTLLGFTRGGGFNVYSGDERLASGD